MFFAFISHSSPFKLYGIQQVLMKNRVDVQLIRFRNHKFEQILTISELWAAFPVISVAPTSIWHYTSKDFQIICSLWLLVILLIFKPPWSEMYLWFFQVLHSKAYILNEMWAAKYYLATLRCNVIVTDT